jgi:hypothetical protein
MGSFPSVLPNLEKRFKISSIITFNERFLLNPKTCLRSVLSELHFLRSRLLGGKKNKAHKGELRFPLPVGYCYDEDGKYRL